MLFYAILISRVNTKIQSSELYGEKSRPSLQPVCIPANFWTCWYSHLSLPIKNMFYIR